MGVLTLPSALGSINAVPNEMLEARYGHALDRCVRTLARAPGVRRVELLRCRRMRVRTRARRR